MNLEMPLNMRLMPINVPTTQSKFDGQLARSYTRISVTILEEHPDSIR